MTIFRLVLQSEPGSGTEFVLDKAEMLLGRDPGSDIVISDPEVSRHHARLLQVGNSYSIEDLGSTNGTFIRGQRLSAPVTLLPGEVITLGERVTVKFEVVGLGVDATIAAFRTPAQTVQKPPAAQPAAPQPSIPAVPDYVSPQQAAPVNRPPQAYESQLPVPPQPQLTPVYAPIAPPKQPVQAVPPAKKKKKSGWVTVILIVIGLILIFCVIPWIIIEITNSYCALLPGIFNAIQPGVCP